MTSSDHEIAVRLARLERVTLTAANAINELYAEIRGFSALLDEHVRQTNTRLDTLEHAAAV